MLTSTESTWTDIAAGWLATRGAVPASGVDELARVLAGRKPAYVAAAEERAARGDFSAEV